MIKIKNIKDNQYNENQIIMENQVRGNIFQAGWI